MKAETYTEATEEKRLLQASRVVSAVFTPFSIPFLAFLVIFFCTYLRMMPLGYKLLVLAIVYIFTIFLPTLTIFLFRKINGFTPDDLRVRRHRYMPFLLTIISYVFCLLTMRQLNLPWYMNGIILAALLTLIICVAFNLRWKLSEHMAGAGGIVGGLVAFSELFGYNPVGWLCIFILVAGMLGSARIILRHHTQGEVLGGFAVGLLCSLAALHPGSKLLIYLFSYILF